MDRLEKVSVTGPDDAEEKETASYTYNSEGNIASKTVGSKNHITYQYTASGSIKETNSGGRTEKFYYNSDGNPEKSIDPAGNETTYTYTPQGLTAKEEVKTDGKVVITRTYTYDKNGNVLKSVVNENGKENVISREYDELGRVTKKEATDSVTSEYIYDVFTADNLLCEISRYENGESSSNVYDEFGRLKYVYSTDITDGEEDTERTEYSYDLKGRRKSIVYPNGTKSEYEYYDNNNIKTLTNYIKDNDEQAESQYKEIEKYEYSYYKNNTMSGKKETYVRSLQEKTEYEYKYEYDELVRLVSTKENRNDEEYRSTSYSYDDSGNRIREESTEKEVKSIKNYKYGEGNLLLGYTVTSDGMKTDEVKYEYDRNGNLTKEYILYENGAACENKLKTKNTYNALNQLVSTQTSDLTVINGYNPEGLRISKEVKENLGIDTSSKTYYTYEYDKVVFETNPQEPENYVWNVHGINLISRQINGEMFCCMYNGHADITVMVDENGELAEKYYYDEWGTETETLRYGDVTGDCEVNANDYTFLMKNIFAESSELTPEQRIVSDLNGDGITDADDLNTLKQIILIAVKHCPADTNRDGYVNEKNNIKYAGYFYDGETGLYYLNARFYDPETARFIQEDTYSGNILDPLSLNLYTYGHNNPISYYDPTGHSIKSIIKSIGNTVKKAVNTVSKSVSKAASSVKKTTVNTAKAVKQGVTSAATSAKNAVVKTSTNFRNDWQSGINQLKESGTAGKIFASYSEGVVQNLSNTASGTVQLVKDPLGTVNESVNYFLEDPLKNNPVAAVGRYYKDIAQASYAHDWETVANKVGSGTATVAEIGGTYYAFKGIKSLKNKTVSKKSVGNAIEVNNAKSAYKSFGETPLHDESTGITNGINTPKIKTGAYSSASNFSGNGLGKLATKELNVSEKGLNIVKNHISQFEHYQPNVDMINRLEKALKNGEKIKSADASFYMHELSEAHMMKDLVKTMDFESAYDVAHSAALNKYEVSQFSVYHPEVIAKNSSEFSLAWKRFWEVNK